MQHKNGIKHASFLSNVFLARLVLYSLDLAQSAWTSDTGLYRAQGQNRCPETLTGGLPLSDTSSRTDFSHRRVRRPGQRGTRSKKQNSKWPNEVEFLVRGGPGHQDGHNGTCPASIGPRVCEIEPKSWAHVRTLQNFHSGVVATNVQGPNR